MGKYIPSLNYWLYIVVFLTLILFPIQIFKNKQIEYFQKEFNNDVELHLINHIKSYEDIAKLIYLNDLKIHEDLVSINRVLKKEQNSNYIIDSKNNLLTFYIKDKTINFNLESFFYKINQKSFFQIVLLDSFETFNKSVFVKKQDSNYIFFTKQNINFLGLKYQFSNQKLIAYKNIENTHLKDISDNFILINLFVVFIVILTFTLIYNIRKFKTNYMYYNSKYDELNQGINRHVLMIKIDTNENITYVTEAFCKWCGYSKVELIGSSFDKLIHDDVSQNFYNRIKSNLDKNSYWEGELKNKDKYGNSLWSKGVITAVLDESDKVVEYSFILVDISDNRQMNKINNLLKEELSNKLNEIKIKEDNLNDKTKVQLMSRILDSIAHQWKEPIANISINLTKFSVNLIENDLENKELLTIHKNIDNELKNLSISLNSFKSMFVKDNSMDKYNVYAVLKDAIEISKDDIKVNNLKVNLDSAKDIYCYGVANEIRYILISLLKHSLMYCKYRNTDNQEINFKVITDNDEVVIQYKDTLESFSTEIIKEVFENENDRIAKDLDNNLHIVKLLIKKTGSKIWFENINNETIFYIKLISKDRRVKDRK